MDSQLTFKQIVHNRYATKQFDGKRIPQEQLNDLLDIIRLAPSSLNIQPWHIIVISDQKLKEQLAPHAWNQPQITSSSHLLVFCADSNIKHRIHLLADTIGETEQTKGYFDMLHNFESSLAEEQKLPFAQRQLYLAVANAINGAKSLGFDSCPMEGFNPQEFAKILKLKNNIVPTALVAIGYASDTARPKVRLEKKDVFELR